jgi:sodium-dependent dicarboxylate transporter 2/3/5
MAQGEGTSQAIKLEEALPPREEAFERARNTIGLFLGPLAAIILWLVPMPVLSYKAHTLTGILAWMWIWFICEAVPLPVSALTAAVLCVLLNVGSAKVVLAPFSDPIIYLFAGSFIIAEAMKNHGLHKRVAYRIMSMKLVGNSTGRLFFAYGVIVTVISMWISHTACTLMMFPIAVGIVYAMADIIAEQTGKKVDPLRLRYGCAMMLMAAYGPSVGGIGTPVGTPPNLIGIALIDKFCGIKISFFEWMVFNVPILIVMFFLLYFLLYFLHKPEIAKIEGSHEYVKRELMKLGKWTPGQRNATIAFCTTVLLWITPGVLALVYGSNHFVTKLYEGRMPEGMAALAGASLLFVLPTNWKKREFTITWKEATKIDWGILIFFGAGLTLGNLMLQTKLAEVTGLKLLELTGTSSVWGITFAGIFLSILLSEFSSNVATANMLVPVMIALSRAAGVDPVPAAIGVTLGASWGFMMPISTPCNAIVYGSGMVKITSMIRAGLVFDILGGLLLWVGLRVMLPLVGLAH